MYIYIFNYTQKEPQSNHKQGLYAYSFRVHIVSAVYNIFYKKREMWKRREKNKSKQSKKRRRRKKRPGESEEDERKKIVRNDGILAGIGV